MKQEIKNHVSYRSVDGRIFQDKYIKNWNLYKVETNLKKYKVSDKYEI